MPDIELTKTEQWRRLVKGHRYIAPSDFRLNLPGVKRMTLPARRVDVLDQWTANVPPAAHTIRRQRRRWVRRGAVWAAGTCGVVYVVVHGVVGVAWCYALGGCST